MIWISVFVLFNKISRRIKLCLYVAYVFILTAFGFSNYPSLSNRLSIFPIIL
ncbi:hypothetical protein BD560DRAFT_413848 [Blakeslea trispora]|nr:hypothetical protein BD560DRAFT_413848 [Blakeslea trispora]